MNGESLKVIPCLGANHQIAVVFQAEPGTSYAGVGAINEFKVGALAMGSKEFQSKQDALMLRNRHGYGANASNRGSFCRLIRVECGAVDNSTSSLICFALRLAGVVCLATSGGPEAQEDTFTSVS